MNMPPSALNLFNNPIIHRFRRSQMRPVRLGITILFTVLMAGFIACMAYLPLHYRFGVPQVDAARTAFIPLLVYQAFILMILGTAAIGGGILRESEEGMIEYQRLTPLSPLAKVLGYLFGLPIRQYVAFGISAIFSVCSIVIGQIPFKAWGSVYLVLFSSIILYHLLGLICGLIIKSRWRAGLISIGCVLLLNVVLPLLADLGFPMFSHLTIRPIVNVHLPDLVPGGRLIGTPDVPFWGWQIPHLAFALIVQGSLIVTFLVILTRRWRDEEAHWLGKAYAAGWLLWVQIILLGNVLPLLESGHLHIRKLGAGTGLLKELSRILGMYEAPLLAVLYGVISLLILFPIISCITPRESTQMVAFRQRKKSGRRYIPWLSDGATAAPWVWLCAVASGAAWATFAERLYTSTAFGGKGFPFEGWAVVISVVFVLAAIFHFLIEAFGRRAAWLSLFLMGFIPLFASLVLISVSKESGETARYLAALSPLSTPWQPLQWLEQWNRATFPVDGKPPDFIPFILFGGVHVALCVMLFTAWRRRRNHREARA